MKEELQGLFDQLQKLQMQIHSALASISSNLSGEKLPDMIDSGFLCREMEEIANDLRKNCADRKGLIAKMIAMRATSEFMTTGKSPVLRGELASATPDLVTKPSIPEPGTEDFNKLMSWLGCSDELIQRGVVRPSFTSLKDIVTRATVEGNKPPPGISLTFTEATVVFRRRKGKKTNGSKEEF